MRMFFLFLALLTRTALIAEVADTAVLKLVPMIAIRAGESIETRVVYGAYSCGEEISPCRRLMVDSPAGEAMDIEVDDAKRDEGELHG